MSRRINYFTGVVGCPDTDVQAFLTATGITDATIINALCTLVTTLKANGIWTKMNALYPFVGGTATTHKFNLKNPADTNGAFRLQFFGGWTHSSNGALPNGTNAYADTFLNPTTLSINSTHLSYYRRTTQAISSAFMGSIELFAGSVFYRLLLSPNFNVVNGNITEIVSTNTQQSSAAIQTLGLILGNRISNSEFKLFVNSTLSQTVSRISTQQPSPNIWIGGANYPINPVYSNNQCAFASIGSGLTDTEALNYYNAVQAFQTTLGRNV